jgi:hypothetical protein
MDKLAIQIGEYLKAKDGKENVIVTDLMLITGKEKREINTVLDYMQYEKNFIIRNTDYIEIGKDVKNGITTYNEIKYVSLTEKGRKYFKVKKNKNKQTEFISSNRKPISELEEEFNKCNGFRMLSVDGKGFMERD